MANSGSLLPQALQLSMQEIITTSNMSKAEIRAILLSTSEGAPLGRVVVADSALHPEMLQMIENVYAPASKQFPVLGLDKLRQVTAVYDHGIIVHIYQGPVVVTILCRAGCNLGAIRSTTTPLLKQVLQPLCNTLEKSLKPEWHDPASDGSYYQ